MSEEDGEASSPPGPVRRKVRRVLVVSSSSSDSDDSVGATRKKRLRVLSDEGSSDSSGSSILCGRRRRRPNAVLKDSESSESDQDEVPAVAPSGFASDSSEGKSDKCSICLLRFKDQPIGTPVNCEHIFCLDCIVEWSKNVNTCPVDRITFDSIIVRSCLGGKVLRSEPIKVVERRSSVDMLVVEDPTVCEVCGSSESEETMLLCDGCDLGFHMACLTPPLNEIPLDQWFCPNCVSDSEENYIYLSEVNDLLDDLQDIERPMAARRHPLREERNIRRSNRSAQQPSDEPSTSSGQRNRAIDNAVLAISSRVGTRRKAQKRRRRSRRTRTVVVEYELEGNDKFPVTKKVTVKRKKRKSKRRPRTAARRSHVRTSVRARLSNLQNTVRNVPDSTTSNLVVQRHMAGIPSLSLFGNSYELDYFCDEPDESASTAVASRSTSSILNSYRQARRKMITIPSPSHASSAPDILSNILESQTLLHAKNSILSVSVDGQVNIKVQKTDPPRAQREKQTNKAQSKDSDGKLDLSKGEDCTKKAPLHGQSRGGWGGGYRGEYTREQTHNYNRSGNREQRDGGQSRGHQPTHGQWRDEHTFDSYQRQAPMYEHYERDRRPAEAHRAGQQQNRHSLNNMWPHNGGHQGPRPPQRHSFGGYDDPLDMRTDRSADEARTRFNFGPLPKQNENNADDREERSPELVIDTEKYDPTEPTNDDDSGDEITSTTQTQELIEANANEDNKEAKDTVKVTSQALQSAVEQVITQHRNLVGAQPPHSDDEHDGDCPNFNIYSAASVHIANTTAASLEPEISQSHQSTTATNSYNRQYNESLSKRCPITTNTRNPIKIKLNTTTLVRPPVSLLYEDEPQIEYSKTDVPQSEPSDNIIKTITNTVPHSDVNIEKSRDSTPDLADEPHMSEKELTPERPEAYVKSETKDKSEEQKDILLDKKGSESESEISQSTELKQPESEEQATPPHSQTNKEHEDDDDDKIEPEERAEDKAQEKMTESISDTEDSRSYTPCLDEKVKEPSVEACVLEGLDTELISEDEGNEDFPESNEPTPPTNDKDKKKRDGKKDKSKSKKDVSFKKLSKSGKERNYRDKDRKRSRSTSVERREERSRRREKRKDLERYDVRNVLTEKKRRVKDAFGRDISPPGSPRDEKRQRSTSRESLSKERNKRRKRSLSRGRRSLSRNRRSISRNRRSLSRKRSPSRSRLRIRRSISRTKRSVSRSRRSLSRGRRAPSHDRRSISISRGRRAPTHERRSMSPPSLVRRRTVTPPRPKRRRTSPEAISKGKTSKKKKRARSPSPPKERNRRAGKRSRDESPEKKITKKKKNKKKAEEETAEPPTPEPIAKHRRHRRHPREPPSSKEVFASGNNILVSVSFKESARPTAEEELAMAIEADERERRREAKRERRRKRQEEKEAPKPVAIIDLDGSPFREIAPSPADVIVLSDTEAPKEEATPAPKQAEAEDDQREAGAPHAHAAQSQSGTVGPKTPSYDPARPTEADSPPSPPAPSPPPPSPPQKVLSLGEAQGGQAEALLDQRPLAPVEKVLALLHSTRLAEPEPLQDKPPTKISALPLPQVKPLLGDSPYSPASSDFGELFSPPGKNHNNNKPGNKLNANGNKNGSSSKTDEDNMKMIEDIPSSAVEMQVKSKVHSSFQFLKKLNRQERVVEEVKLVLKPHYNKKHVTKEEYKDILRRAVPKICHNRSGEINPAKIQALIEAYVRKSRKKRKMPN